MKGTFTGFPKVLAFTMKMTTGSAAWKRTTVIFAVILFLIPLAILTISAALGDSEAETDFAGSLQTLYTVDETEGNVDYSMLTATDPQLSGVVVAPCASYNDAREKLNADPHAMMLYVTRSDGIYHAALLTGEETMVEDGDRDLMTNLFAMRFSEVQVLKSGLTAEEMMQLVIPVTINTLGSTEAPGESDDFTELQQETVKEMLVIILPYVTVMFLYFFVLFYGQSAAQLIVMEKTSKLMDTILVSIRPAAMIFGKFTANLCCAVIQLIVWILSLLGGFAAGLALAGAIDPVNTYSFAEIKELLSVFDGMFSPVSVILALLLMLAGCVLYTSLASIGGALAGKQEDLQSTNMLFTMALVISFMTVVFGGNLMETGQMASAPWMHFVPFTAVLITPSHVLLGNVSPLMGLGSFCLILIFSAAILLCAGKLYKLMSFYKGNPPKLKQIIGLLRTK